MGRNIHVFAESVGEGGFHEDPHSSMEVGVNHVPQKLGLRRGEKKNRPIAIKNSRDHRHILDLTGNLAHISWSKRKCSIKWIECFSAYVLAS